MFPKNRFPLGIAVAVLLLVPGTLIGAEEPVVVKNYGNAMQFFPQVEAEDMILTVTGPCNYEIRRSLREDGELIFKLDETTIDGIFRFEVTVIPRIDGSILDVLQDARKTGDNAEVDKLCREGALPGDPLIQTAGFRVFNARILYDPEKVEDFGGTVPKLGDHDLPNLNKDFVINDDLIVDGSACIGFDCVNGEVFSFDTLRLKENNLRIHFDDTSTAASFPRNDWTLLANDSANGGASKFSIEDRTNARTPFTVEANARSHSLYVDDGGRIGNRTSTPSVEIHSIDGDTPTLRLQQDGSSGFQPQTWDVAGNETNFFVRDVTNGSTLPFRIRPGAPSSAIFIDVDGDVGMGTTSPNADIHIRDTAADDNAELQLEANGQAWKWRANAANNQMNIIDDTGSTTPLRIAAGTSNNVMGIGINTAGSDASTTVSFGRDGGPNVTVDIQGSVIVDGTTEHADYVFEPDYKLPSIEENAQFMWQNKHLPSLPKAPEGLKGRVDLVGHQMGMLEELEKAHIYIEQLHDALADQKAVIDGLAARLDQLEVEK